MRRYEIAQLNVARALFPLDSPELLGFMERLDEINELAERSPGFRWRLQRDSGNATDLLVWDDPLVIVNLTVWETIDDLHSSRTARTTRPSLPGASSGSSGSSGPPPFWWQPEGEIPTLDDALLRLDLLAENGPTSEAFTFKRRFPAPSG